MNTVILGPDQVAPVGAAVHGEHLTAVRVAVVEQSLRRAGPRELSRGRRPGDGFEFGAGAASAERLELVRRTDAEPEAAAGPLQIHWRDTSAVRQPLGRGQ